ncbi:MAG: type II toxin-antitoxin system PemK/MazF family toxin [Blastocatellia bacterium]
MVSTSFGDNDRVLITVVPHTTELRGSEYEASANAPFLKPGAFLVQGISTYPAAWAIRKLGVLNSEKFDLVFSALLRWLGHDVH